MELLFSISGVSFCWRFKSRSFLGPPKKHSLPRHMQCKMKRQDVGCPIQNLFSGEQELSKKVIYFVCVQRLTTISMSGWSVPENFCNHVANRTCIALVPCGFHWQYASFCGDVLFLGLGLHTPCSRYGLEMTRNCCMWGRKFISKGIFSQYLLQESRSGEIYKSNSLGKLVICHGGIKCELMTGTREENKKTFFEAKLWRYFY